MKTSAFAFQRVLDNSGFTVRTSQRGFVGQAGAVPTPALGEALEPISRFRMAGRGMKLTHSRHLSGVQQIPIRPHPNHEEVFTFRRQGHIFGMPHRERFAIGQVQLKGAKGSAVPHLLEVGDFHVLNPALTKLPGFSIRISWLFQAGPEGCRNKLRFRGADSGVTQSQSGQPTRQLECSVASIR